VGPLQQAKGSDGGCYRNPEAEGKVRITIRLDQDVVDRFLQLAEASGGETGYQTRTNAALREYLDGKSPRFEDTLRRIIREELNAASAA
jgi:uncharacterized protein (DUF4415 family)